MTRVRGVFGVVLGCCVLLSIGGPRCAAEKTPGTGAPVQKEAQQSAAPTAGEHRALSDVSSLSPGYGLAGASLVNLVFERIRRRAVKQHSDALVAAAQTTQGGIRGQPGPSAPFGFDAAIGRPPYFDDTAGLGPQFQLPGGLPNTGGPAGPSYPGLVGGGAERPRIGGGGYRGVKSLPVTNGGYRGGPRGPFMRPPVGRPSVVGGSRPPIPGSVPAPGARPVPPGIGAGNGALPLDQVVVVGNRPPPPGPTAAVWRPEVLVELPEIVREDHMFRPSALSKPAPPSKPQTQHKPRPPLVPVTKPGPPKEDEISKIEEALLAGLTPQQLEELSFQAIDPREVNGRSVRASPARSRVVFPGRVV